MRKRFIALLFLMVCTPLAAQQALSNDSVIKLVKSGFSDDLIISTINASPGTFDTSVDGIIALKTAGASDKVVSAILLKGAAISGTATAPVPPGPQAAQDPNDPASRHEPGIYLMSTSSDGTKKMVLLNPASIKLRSTNTFGNAMSMGISSVRVKSDISGTRAVVRTTNIRPEFYIYYPPASTLGLSSGPGYPSDQFNLRLLEVEGDHRVTTVAQSSLRSYNGAEKAKHDKWTINFRNLLK
jgi:hypothetical protein